MSGTKNMIITLFMVALVCSVVLSFVYSYTAPRITETQKQMMLDGLKEVIGADEFAPVIPDTLWEALDASGEPVGIVFRVFPRGYAGPIPIMVGLDRAGAVTGVRIASAAEGMSETPGLGAKITEQSFTEQFIGKCAAAIGLKRDGGEIDAITAATISSRAVCSGIKQGIETYAEYVDSGIDKRCVLTTAQQFVEIIEDTLWYATRGGETLGIVFVGVTDGYADRIEFMVGVDMTGTITGVDILYSAETPGIGELIREQEFLDSFGDAMPDAITGATVSSQALIDAVGKGIARFKEYLHE
jgi:electron transport complex protein RnfG